MNKARNSGIDELAGRIGIRWLKNNKSWKGRKC